MASWARKALMVAAGIALFGAMIHLVGPWLEAETEAQWYDYWGAPPQIVEGARAGVWTASAVCAAIGAAMLLAGLYALSAAGVGRRLPLTRAALWVLAPLCLLRGLVLIPLWFHAPDRVGVFEVVASAVWFVAGVGFLWGLLRFRALQTAA